MVTQATKHEFQAETKQLLNIVINSLYTNKDIFLREMISNASDAIDKLRIERLTRPDLEIDDNFQIALEVDKEARTLTISDNGMGMSRDEVVSNIGTIARSGTDELRQKGKAGEAPPLLNELIGQFGVGFYSSFMAADRVTLITRRADEDTATKWESSGDGYYTLSDAERENYGTSITLHLKPVDLENGIEDFTDEWVLARVIKKYSDFINYPIVCKHNRKEAVEGKETEADNSEVFDKVLNSMKPVWTRPQAEVTEAEYRELYRHISRDWGEPLKTISLKAEGVFEYQAVLFIPSKSSSDLFYNGTEFGLRLYAQRVMVVEQCEELLPRYLRFIKGLVDSADLPLNISRQTLQQDRHISQIRKWLTKKILSTLESMNRDEPEVYRTFWGEFGRALKEGISADYDNRESIIPLLLFESSHDDEKLTTLKQYTERMKGEQQEIFYLTGESRSVVENSPHLEAFKEKGYEVLYLTDPVDELLVQSLSDYEGKKLRSVMKGTIKLGDEEESNRVEEELKKKEEEYADLLGFLQKKLDAYVKQVKLTNRLVTSPACLTGTEIDYSPHLERLLQKGKQGGPRQRRILELNPNHQTLIKMQERFQKDSDDPALADSAHLLLGYALLAEGSELPDPVEFNRLVSKLLVQTL